MTTIDPAWEHEIFNEKGYERDRWVLHGLALRRVVRKMTNFAPGSSIVAGPWQWEVRDFTGGSMFQGRLLRQGLAATRADACAAANAAADKIR